MMNVPKAKSTPSSVSCFLSGLQPQCPVCGQSEEWHSSDLHSDHIRVKCDQCGHCLECPDGIWRALSSDGERHYANFVRDYSEIRRQEGRGGQDARFYLALPYADLSRHFSHQWRIRARTFEFVCRNLLSKLPRHSRILDLGAGNCWFSYRLRKLGYRSVAVDLNLDSFDGLGAGRYYQRSSGAPLERVHAEYDCLPFADRQFACAVFNASFHYTEDPCRTLKEVIRCIRPGGMLIIADSPWYSSEESGMHMVQEKHQRFQNQFGKASDALSSIEFLTDQRLGTLEVECGIRWHCYRPFYGIRWALRPWLAKLQGKREPSQFEVYVAEVGK
jgi:SAM-dependent methyltransferase